MFRMKLILTVAALLFLLSQSANADDTIKVLMLAGPNDQAPSDQDEILTYDNHTNEGPQHHKFVSK